VHFYPKISVAAIALNNELKEGDRILIEGHENSVEQSVDSMQIDGKNVKSAGKGKMVGLKVAQQVKEKDLVYLA